jgi:uncharacterized protein
MPLLVNLRHLEKRNLVLEGEIAPEELDMVCADELIQARSPLTYELEAQLLDQSLLVRGELQIVLDCQCVRCLKSFKFTLELADFAVHLELEGDEAVAVAGDCVDLTPILREDTLLEFPQHPLCKPGCVGLTSRKPGKKKPNTAIGPESPSSAWSELDKLKL